MGKPTQIHKIDHFLIASLGKMLAEAKLTSLGFQVCSEPFRYSEAKLMLTHGTGSSLATVQTQQWSGHIAEVSLWRQLQGYQGVADWYLFIEIELNSMTPSFRCLSAADVQEITQFDEHGNAVCCAWKVREVANENCFSQMLERVASTYPTEPDLKNDAQLAAALKEAAHLLRRSPQPRTPEATRLDAIASAIACFDDETAKRSSP